MSKSISTNFIHTRRYIHMHECLTTIEGAVSYLPQRFRQPHSLELGAGLEDSFLTIIIMFSRAQIHYAICNNSRCDSFIRMVVVLTSVLCSVPGVPNYLRSGGMEGEVRPGTAGSATFAKYTAVK